MKIKDLYPSGFKMNTGFIALMVLVLVKLYEAQMKVNVLSKPLEDILMTAAAGFLIYGLGHKIEKAAPPDSQAGQEVRNRS